MSAYASYNLHGKAPFSGKDLDPQQIYEAPDPQAGYPVIHFAMQNARLQDFATYTQQNTGSMLTVTYLIKTWGLSRKVDDSGSSLP